MNAGTTLILKRTFPASCERVFAMWTSAELMMKWFCPGKDMTVPVAEVDAREGASYRIVMQNKDGETYSPSNLGAGHNFITYLLLLTSNWLYEISYKVMPGTKIAGTKIAAPLLSDPGE